jgi:hypothetical protein
MSMSKVLAVLLAATVAAVAETKPGEGIRVLDLEPVWSGHPVGFCLLTKPPHQFVAYYDAQRRMTVAQRRLDEAAWRFTKLDSTLGWDSHNYVTMALDRDGRLHLSGNMHCVPLVYFRGEAPFDASTLTRMPGMTGEREKKSTYPVFLRDKAGRLVFRYRDGSSGSGDDLYNVYDEKAGAWRRLIDGPLLSGEGKMNAYAVTPRQGPDGRFHITWVWRDTPDCASNHDLSYARSDDLVNWTDSSGRPLALPITIRAGEIVDPVPARGGLLNANRELGFDNAGRPVITYHKYDKAGDLQIHAARRDPNGWTIVQVSDWTGYRWEFSGGGTILCEVNIGAVEPLGGGRVALAYRYPRGAGTWVLDESTLRPIPGAKPPSRGPGLPRQFGKIESPFPGMKKKTAGDAGEPPPGSKFVLVWETLDANRDRPRPPPLPGPSMLRLVEIPAPASAAAPAR